MATKLEILLSVKLVYSNNLKVLKVRKST